MTALTDSTRARAMESAQESCRGDTWLCGVCTLENPLAAGRCEACTARRPSLACPVAAPRKIEDDSEEEEEASEHEYDFEYEPPPEPAPPPQQQLPPQQPQQQQADPQQHEAQEEPEARAHQRQQKRPSTDSGEVPAKCPSGWAAGRARWAAEEQPKARKPEVKPQPVLLTATRVAAPSGGEEAKRGKALHVHMGKAEAEELARAEGLPLVQASNSSGFRGVYYRPREASSNTGGMHPYVVNVYIDKRIVMLGSFTNSSAASLAYARFIGCEEALKAQAAYEASMAADAPLTAEQAVAQAQREGL
eukprot:4146377-Prymnesium_polylepis.1